jgi:hypothetical protein
MNDAPWQAIAERYNLLDHDFNAAPFPLTAQQIKDATEDFDQTNEREVRILCKQDTREARPAVFQENNLFLLPTKNGEYAVVRGEGYVDIPPIASAVQVYQSVLDFHLDTSEIGNSEMQHLDFAYACSLVRTFLGDPTLVLTIRGRKYSPAEGFRFRVGGVELQARSVQTEVDAGYEGRNQVVLVEAKSPGKNNTIIRQLFYPFRQWQAHTDKQVRTVFFEGTAAGYSLWEFRFNDAQDYNSIELVRSQRFTIAGP